MLYKVFYTSKFVKEWAAGKAFGPLIFIKPEHMDDKAVLEHELEHVRQFWSKPFTHGLRYVYSNTYRLWAEVEAYRVSVKNGAIIEACAKSIATNYDLDISEKYALELLKER